MESPITLVKGDQDNFFAIREVEDFVDIEGMRVVRNTVRQYMTNNTDEISREQQMQWYAQTYVPARLDRELFGFIVTDESAPIGYGIASKRNERWWVSGGLIDKYRGYHLGTHLFAFLTNFIHCELDQDEAWLDVRPNNEVAQHVYAKLGYVATGTTDKGMVMMRHTQPAGSRMLYNVK